MPAWAVMMQGTLMKHMSQEVEGLKSQVDEAMVVAMEAQEEVRALRKEVEKLKGQQSGDSVKEEVQKVVEEVVSKTQIRQPNKYKDEEEEWQEDGGQEK
eukprot:777202-Karenia_brevis.AAC.1